MLHKSSFEKACGNTIWCCTDEITTRQVQEDNLRKRPQMLCVSVVRSSEFELHCPRRSINEGSEMCSDKSSQERQEALTFFQLHSWGCRDNSSMILQQNEGTWKPDFSSQLKEKSTLLYRLALLQIAQHVGPFKCFKNIIFSYIYFNHVIIMCVIAKEEFNHQSFRTHLFVKWTSHLLH